MKHFSWIGMFVALSFISLFIFFLSEGRSMARNKKNTSTISLEDHVIKWACNQIELIRGAVDEIEDDIVIGEQDRLSLFMGIAQNLSEIALLLNPIFHEETDNIKWMNEFIDRYSAVYEFEL